MRATGAHFTGKVRGDFPVVVEDASAITPRSPPLKRTKSKVLEDAKGTAWGGRIDNESLAARRGR